MTQFVIDQQLKIQDLISRLTTREEGQDMVEYALLAALISIVAIAIILLVGPYLGLHLPWNLEIYLRRRYVN